MGLDFKRTIYIVVVGVLVAFAIVSNLDEVNSTPESVGICSDRLERVDSVCNMWIEQGMLPHISAMVVRHGKVVFQKAYGWRDMDKQIPLQKDDIFRNASQTKAITSVALMTLYEQGKFGLDDPISRYIPEFRKPQVLDKIEEDGRTYTSHPARREITFRDLLTHRSGISYATLWGHPTYTLCKDLNIPNISSTDSITIADAVKLYAQVPLEAEPGERWIYGWNLDIAGYLIEILSGMSFDEYLRQVIFEPLGMKDTYFFLPDDKADRLVTIYNKRGPKGQIVRCDNEFYQTYPISGAKTYFSGGGGLCGTVEDYSKFCQMMLNKGTYNGHHVLGKKTVELMLKNQMGTGSDGWGWNLGFELVGNNKEVETLASAGSYFWSGMFKTFYHIDPKEDMAMLFYFNALDFYDPGYFEKFKFMVYQSIVE